MGSRCGRRATWRGSSCRWGSGSGAWGACSQGAASGGRRTRRWGSRFRGSPASEAQFKLHEIDHLRDWSQPVHPTQIYESAVSLAIAAFLLLWLHPRKRYDGHVFAAFIGLYAAGRFALEVLRADDRGGLFGLSTSQLYRARDDRGGVLHPPAAERWTVAAASGSGGSGGLTSAGRRCHRGRGRARRSHQGLVGVGRRGCARLYSPKTRLGGGAPVGSGV
ncbi:MAG: prolipoprotein diacylglyceryl transferase [Polyangiaceae bacterium]